MIRSSLATLAMTVILIALSGATCVPRRSTVSDFQPKPIFNATPSVEQIAETLNRSRNIQSLQSNFVTVNPNKVRNLDASLAWQRQRKFKIAGGISRMLGNNFEVGSNDQTFWMAIRDGGKPQLVFADHNEFESQSVRRILPVSPLWLIEALGVIELDPNQLIKEPSIRPDGMMEISTLVPSATGNYSRTLVVDPKFGFTRGIYLWDPSGRLVANATQSEHEYYTAIQMSLPRKIVLQLIPAIDPPTELDISISNYNINSLDPNDVASYTFPSTNGFDVVNLVQFNQGSAQAVTPIQVSPPQSRPSLSVRGVPWDGSSMRR